MDQPDVIQTRPNEDGSGDAYSWDAEKGEWVFMLHYDETRTGRVFDTVPEEFKGKYETLIRGNNFFGVPDTDKGEDEG